jgi:flagellar hook-basal body complex protein FliE
MPVAGIPALGAVQPTGYADVSSLVQAGGAGGAGGVADVTGVAEAKTLAVKAVTGDLTDIHDATIAATRAQVTLELVSAVRNKAVDAFTEIMRMQA